MTKIEKIICDCCGSNCHISFEIFENFEMPYKHEIYWLDTKGIIQAGSVNEYRGKYVKDVIKDRIHEVTGECKKCGIGDATLTLKDGYTISTASLTNECFWGLF